MLAHLCLVATTTTATTTTVVVGAVMVMMERQHQYKFNLIKLVWSSSVPADSSTSRQIIRCHHYAEMDGAIILVSSSDPPSSSSACRWLCGACRRYQKHWSQRILVPFVGRLILLSQSIRQLYMKQTRTSFKIK